MASTSAVMSNEDDPDRMILEQIKHARYVSGKDVDDLVTTKHHVLSLYGSPTPGAVNESLFSQGAKDRASVNANSNAEYAWYVFQRKLLLWRFRPKSDEKTSCSIAIELLLPKSDLPHHAQLVCVFKARQSRNPSCVAVSPEGIVRFWEVLSPHSSWVDVNANLGGEEVCSVYYVPPYGCLAVTTSASIFLIKPEVIKSSLTITVKHISKQQGWLSGFSQRVSTIIFGSNDSHGAETSDNKVIKLVTVPGIRRGAVEWQAFLLVGMKLQLIKITKDQTANSVYEVDIDNLIRGQISLKNANVESAAILDVKASEGGVAILVGILHPRKYILFELPCRDESSPINAFVLCDLCPRDIDILEMNSGRMASLQFLLLPTTALIFNRRTIIGVPMDGGLQSPGDVLTIPGEGVILGGINHKGAPAFFSPTYGFVAIQPVESACYNILKSSDQKPSIMGGTTEGESQMMQEQKHMSSIKTAFLMYIRQNMKQCHFVVDKDFPRNFDRVDSPLSLTLFRFSLDIIHHVPGSDPRWDNMSSGAKFLNSASLHIGTQLQEKLKAHNMFVDFVSTALKNNIGKITKNGKEVDVLSVVCEHNDKLVAASKLWALHHSYGSYIDNAIHSTLRTVGLNFPQSSLSPKDIFYHYVSVVDVGLKTLIEKCAEIYNADEAFTRKRKLVSTTYTVVKEVAVAVINKQRDRAVQCQINWLNDYEEDKSTYDHFHLLFEMLRSVAEKISSEEEILYNDTLTMLRDWVDIILHLQSTTRPPERFAVLRSWYIQYFIDEGHYLYAKQLAIKFQDMKTLVALTYLLKEEDNIPKYMETFGHLDICETVFDHLLSNGLKADLLNLAIRPEDRHKMSKALDNYPELYWMNEVANGQMREACSSLVKYASLYKNNVEKSERIWSLAKLLCKCQGIDDFIDQIDRNLECIGVQNYFANTLSRYLCQEAEVQDEVQVIQSLVSPQVSGVTEHHFLKALHLLRFVDDPNVGEQLKNDLWSRAAVIDKEEIEALKVDSSIEEFLNILVFRLLQTIVALDEEYGDLMPNFENLNVSEDPDVSKRLLYFLRLGHEHLVQNFQFKTPGDS